MPSPRRPAPARFSAAAQQPSLPRSERRSQGAYYTPPEVAQYIARQTLRPALANWSSPDPPRIIDPACGAGALLQAAAAELQAAGFSPGVSLAALHGRDVDATAVDHCCRALAQAADARSQGAAQLARQIRAGDALRETEAAAFDVVLGNPPYVNIRQLARSLSPDERRDLARRFRTARGNFDLYVLFIERALELLRPGGWCGLIVPNKFAALDYARACRELLLERATLAHLADLSGLAVFPGAGVYPCVLVFRNQPAPAGHGVQVREARSPAELDSAPLRRVPQSRLSADRFVWQADLEVERRSPTAPLAERAELHSGASGYHARDLLKLLAEGPLPETSGPACPFIVSGNIDPYRIQGGNVRFLGQRFRQPWLRLDAERLSPRKRRLYQQPKLVIAGLARQLEVAWDDRGLALGVQVFAVAEPRDDPFYLLALLNSRLLTFLFRRRFAAKRLAGGYLAVNKGQLATLPIRLVDPADAPARRRQAELIRLARQLHAGEPRPPGLADALAARIDALVEDLYCLTPADRANLATDSASTLRAA